MPDQLHLLHTLRKCRRHAPLDPLRSVSKATRPLRAREPHFPKGEGTQSHARCGLRCSVPLWAWLCGRCLAVYSEYDRQRAGCLAFLKQPRARHRLMRRRGLTPTYRAWRSRWLYARNMNIIPSVQRHDGTLSAAGARRAIYNNALRSLSASKQGPTSNSHRIAGHIPTARLPNTLSSDT